jgi:hypothetical protein
MPESPMTESHKRALIVAYYMSRFDRKGVRLLGFDTFNEAFAKIGKTLSVPASTVKHMRDSFDPYCSQVRVGWYQRKILPSRANVIQAYDELSEAAMAEIVHEILSGDEKAAQLYTAPISNLDDEAASILSENTSFANRLRTGDKAEAFFMEQFPQLGQFRGSVLEDTRKLGIGFDFRASFPSSFQAIEVKGVCNEHGYISFTDKEWSVAHILQGDYLLALVRGLDYKPVLDFVPNPTLHLTARMQTIESVSVCWNAKV